MFPVASEKQKLYPSLNVLMDMYLLCLLELATLNCDKNKLMTTYNSYKFFNDAFYCRQIENLRRCEIIKESEVKALCAKVREILVEESNVQRVDSPVTVSKYDTV